MNETTEHATYEEPPRMEGPELLSQTPETLEVLARFEEIIKQFDKVSPEIIAQLETKEENKGPAITDTAHGVPPIKPPPPEPPPIPPGRPGPVPIPDPRPPSGS